MADYYELLGISPEASREDIRDAYRDLSSRTAGDDKARLNQAWSVLSDPYQRGRYDQQVSDGTARDAGDAELEVIDDEPLDPRAARAKARADARQRSLVPDPLPAGLQYPAPAQRFTAFGIDIFVLLLVFFPMYLFVLVGGPLKQDLTAQQQANKATWTQQIDAKKAQATSADTAKDKANAAAATAKKDKDAAEEKSQQADAKAQDTKAKGLRDDINKLEDKKFKLDAPSTTQIAVFAIVTPLIMLAYLVFPSLRRGQTVGKKFRGIRVVSINGADAAATQLLIRYGLPVVVAVDGFIALQQIAPLLALFGVLLWPRHKLRQGLHDRLAKTLVVDNTVDLLDA